MNNLVSIITPVHNSEMFLEECIRSVLSQTYKNWELILIDDCSTDNSIHIINQYKTNAKIKLIKQSENTGAGIARNKGIQAAKGDYISFLDADDYWLKDKLEKQINFMKAHKYSFSYSQYYEINESHRSKKIVLSPPRVDYQKMLDNDYIGCLTAIYDCRKLGKMYMPPIRKRQDWILWISILKKIDYAHGLQEPLAYYRVGNSSLSNNKIKLLKYNFNVFHKELSMPFFKSIFMMINFLAHYFYFKLTSIKTIK